MATVNSTNMLLGLNQGRWSGRSTLTTARLSEIEIIQLAPWESRLISPRLTPQSFPVGLQKALLLAAERPDQIRPFDAPAAQGLSCRLVLPDQLAA